MLAAASSFVYAASGGLTLGGAATTLISQHRVYSPSGGLTLAGAATTHVNENRVYSGSGGLTLGGAATTLAVLGHVYTPSGGITLGGSDPHVFIDVHEYSGSGGLTLAGAATTAPTLTHPYSASGGLTLGGAATTFPSVHKVYAPSGGITLGGSAPHSRTLNHPYSGSGGLTLAGAAATAFRGTLIELYPNNAETTLTGNYTSGDGHVDVASTASPFKATGSYRLTLSNPANGAVRVILRVLAVFSPTRFITEPEGADANAFTGDFATATNTEGAMYATRADISRTGTEAQLPTAGVSRKGDQYFASDGFHSRFDGSNWQQFGDSILQARPAIASFTARNAGSATAVDSGPGIVFKDVAAESGLHGWELAAPGGAWSLRVRLFPSLELNAAEAPSVGIYVRDSGSGELRTLAIRNNQVAGTPGLYLGVDDWTDENTFDSAVFGPLGLLLASDGIWLAIDEDGSDGKTFSVMADGVNLTTLHSGTFTADQVGFYVETTGSARLLQATLKSWVLA